MATMNEQKLFAGPRIRRMRKDRALTQARMADELGISTSYLTLIERNQRPLTAQLLLRLVEIYDVDFKDFTGNAEAQALAALQEVFSDPLFEGADISRHELAELAATSPDASQAVLTLYHAYRESATNVAELSERLTVRGAGEETFRFPAEQVREFLQDHDNHFPALEAAAEEFHESAELRADDMYGALKRHLTDSLGIGVNLVPAEMMPTTLRVYDHHRRRILLSEMLAGSGRVFQLAYQIALLRHGPLLDRLVASSKLSDAPATRLGRVNLASYFAAAVMMPYERFLTTADSLRYDIDILAQRFGASFEQTCHRLTTLQRRGARGVPFFMIRIDNAGNVSKRFSAGSFQFARLGGACPRWNVHDAFQTPGRIYTQMIEMPDGPRYFSIARTVNRSGTGFRAPEQQLALGLGCEIQHAPRLVYADGYDTQNSAAATPIGINCRLCERADCNQRAFPPINRGLIVDECRREISPYAFSAD